MGPRMRPVATLRLAAALRSGDARLRVDGALDVRRGASARWVGEPPPRSWQWGGELTPTPRSGGGTDALLRGSSADLVLARGRLLCLQLSRPPRLR